MKILILGLNFGLVVALVDILLKGTFLGFLNFVRFSDFRLIDAPYCDARSISFPSKVGCVGTLDVDSLPRCDGSSMGIFSVFDFAQSFCEGTFIPEKGAPVEFSLLNDDIVQRTLLVRLTQ